MESGTTFTMRTEKSKVAVCILLLLLTLTIAALIVLAVLLRNQINKNDIKVEGDTGINEEIPTGLCTSENTIDLAIVGAGVSGSYAAWKLSQKYDWNIQMFDANNRAGGRLYSIDIPGIGDFKADLGAMRFKSSHSNMEKLIQELGLTIQNFTTPTSDNTLYYLRDHLLTKQDVETGNVPYLMTEYERNISSDSSALHVYWNNLIIANSSKSLSDSWLKKCVDGKYAYEKGNYNAFLEVASREAIEYLAYRDLFPGEYFNNLNYAEWATTDYVPEPSPSPPQQVYTIKEGFQQLVKEMNRRFLQKTKSSLFLQHILQSVHYNNKGLAKLTFLDSTAQKFVDVCAKKVILALPAEAIGHIHFHNKDLLNNITPLLGTVNKAPAMKTFLAYDKPWWRTGGQRQQFVDLKNKGIDLKFIATDMPLGTLLDIGVDSQSGKSLLLSYADWWINVNFWKPYQEAGNVHRSNIITDVKVTENLINQMNIQLSKIFNITLSQLPQPYAAVSQAWYKAPHWTAWHDKSGGYNFSHVMDQVMKPVADKDLFIIGEAFSNSQAWTEGALESAHKLLTTYFK